MNTRVDAIYWQRRPYLCPQFGDLSADRGWQGLFGLRRHRKTNVVAKPAAALILWSQLRLFLYKSNINELFLRAKQNQKSRSEPWS